MNAPHIFVEALAGTGKTTTLVEGLKYISGQTLTITPSAQQSAIWDCMAEEIPTTVLFTAFNKSIASELQARIPEQYEASTLHSKGLSIIRQHIKLQPGRKGIDGWRTNYLVEQIMDTPLSVIRKDNPVVLFGTKKLVSLAKVNLTDPIDENLAALCSHYGVILNGEAATVYDLTRQVLDLSKDLSAGVIDFDDMIWLPVVLNLPVDPVDLLLWDEAQDGNRCQQELVSRLGNRRLYCGDRHQAIYGFAGADAESVSRLQSSLQQTDRGLEIFPLTVTRRCGKAIVTEAQSLVSDFQAHDDNPDGEVNHLDWGSNWRNHITDDAMILCRVNAPLLGEYFKLIKQKKKAYIQGRDFGEDLLNSIKRLYKKDFKQFKSRRKNKWNHFLSTVQVFELIERMTAWTENEVEKEQKKRRPSTSRIIGLQDRLDCIICLAENCETVSDLLDYINIIFQDDAGEGIRLSSIHRSKGLEADTVFLIEPQNATVPHPMAKQQWEITQEYNLRYVAITRAIRTLFLITDTETDKDDE